MPPVSALFSSPPPRDRWPWMSLYSSMPNISVSGTRTGDTAAGSVAAAAGAAGGASAAMPVEAARANMSAGAIAFFMTLLLFVLGLRRTPDQPRLAGHEPGVLSLAELVQLGGGHGGSAGQF